MAHRTLRPAVSLLLAGAIASPVGAATPPARPPRTPEVKAKPAPPPPAFEGLVRGPDGKPIAKALVVASAHAHAPGESPFTTRTDAQGRFKLTVRRAAKHTLRAESAGLAGRTLRDVVPGAPLTIDLASGGTIEGVVRDGETGQPAAGIRVTTRDFGAIALSDDPDAGRIQATTDAEGRFKLTGLAAGRHDVSARARGRGYASRKAVPLGSRVEMLLQPAATLFGVVTGPDGKPVAGAVVTPQAVRSTQGPRAERSDERGRYEVTGLPAGMYDIAVRAPGLAPAAVPEVVVDARGETQVDVALQQGARVTGRLVDANEKALTGRVSIGELGGHPTPYLLADLLRAEAGADGRFAIDAVPTGAHAMAADAPGQAVKRVELEVSSTQRAVDLGDVRMETGLVIRGRVRSAAGQPVADATVQAHAERSRTGTSTYARTDAEGAFALAGLEAVTHRLFASASGFGRADQQAEPGGEPVDLVLEAAGRIAGQVVDDRGRPIESFRVIARPSGDQGPQAFDQFDASDGRFELENVDPGPYAVTVEAPDYAPAGVSAKVTAGSAADVGTVRLSAGATLRGTVVDSAGSFVSGARITVTYPRPQGVVTTFDSDPEILSDRSGAFEAKGVKQGPLEVTASHASYARSLPVSLVVDASPTPDVRLVLTQGARIEGSFRRRDGAPVAGSFVVATPLREESWNGGPLVPVQPDGTFLIEHVPAGRIRVTTMTNAGRSTYRSAQVRELDVREGETATLDIVNREILLSGRVTRAGGPVTGLRVEAQGSGVSFGARGQSVPPAAGGPERMTAVTREDGTFEMLLDEPGAVRMTVWSADQRFRFPSRTVQVPDADAFTTELAFDGAPVNGVVVDKDTEAPLPYARVTASAPSRPGGGATATAGADGRFQLELEPDAYQFWAYAKEATHSNAGVSVDVGPAGATDVRIELPRGLRITGKALDPTGRPVAEVRVMAVGPGLPAASYGSSDTMADGSFEMRGLRNVDHRVTAWSDTGLFAIRPGVGAGTTDLPLRLQSAARVVVQVVTADGRPVAGVTPTLGQIDGSLNMSGMGVCRAPTNAQGRAEVLTPAGRLTLAATRGNLGGYSSVEVEAGGTATVRITLEPMPGQQYSQAH